MTDRRVRGPRPAGRMPAREEIALDDAFLDALGRGDAGARGAGPGEVDAALAGLFAAAARAGGPVPAPPALPPRWAPAGDADDADAAGDGRVVPLHRAGGGRHRGRGVRVAGVPLPGRLTTALLGAAAASVLMIGGMSAVLSAEPGGALWPLRQQLVGQESVAVELAATLERADAAAGDGDAEKARRLMAYAEQLLAEVDDRDRDRMHAQLQETRERIRYVVVPGTTTVTSTRERTAPRETDVRTVRETVTERTTTTVTERPPAPAPAPAPAPDSGERGDAPPAPGDDRSVSGEPMRSSTPPMPSPTVPSPSVPSPSTPAPAPAPRMQDPAVRPAVPPAAVPGDVGAAAPAADAG